MDFSVAGRITLFSLEKSTKALEEIFVMLRSIITRTALSFRLAQGAGYSLLKEGISPVPRMIRTPAHSL